MFLRQPRGILFSFWLSNFYIEFNIDLTRWMIGFEVEKLSNSYRIYLEVLPIEICIDWGK
jgi:hypothetical protein